MSAISKRQENHFIFALRVAMPAARGIWQGSSVLRSIVYHGCHGMPQQDLSPSRRSTFGQGFALLASLQCSFQLTSGKVGYSWRIKKKFCGMTLVRRHPSIVRLFYDLFEKCFRAPLKIHKLCFAGTQPTHTLLYSLSKNGLRHMCVKCIH